LVCKRDFACHTAKFAAEPIGTNDLRRTVAARPNTDAPQVSFVYEVGNRNERRRPPCFCKKKHEAIVQARELLGSKFGKDTEPADLPGVVPARIFTNGRKVRKDSLPNVRAIGSNGAKAAYKHLVHVKSAVAGFRPVKLVDFEVAVCL